MACIYLTGRQFKMCNAVEGSLVLSLDELVSRCQDESYPICKIYQRCHGKGTKVPLMEYQRGMSVLEL